MKNLSITRGENQEVDKAMDALMDALGIEIPEGEEEADIDASKHTAETYWKWYNDFLAVGFNQNQAFALTRDQAKAFQTAWLMEDDDDGEGEA